MDCLAVGRDRRAPDRAEIVVDGRRRLNPFRTALCRFRVGSVHVLDLKRDVTDAVAVPMDVLRREPLGLEGRGEHESDLSLLEHVGGAVAHFRLEAGVGGHREAEGVGVEKGGLPRVSHPEFQVVDGSDLQEIVALGHPALTSPKRPRGAAQ